MYDLREAVAALNPGAIQEYLRSRGWSLKADLSETEGIVLYEHGGHILDVPLHPEYIDYTRRMAEVIVPLAELEGVSPLALIDDLTSPAGDVFSVRIQSDRATSGTLPFLDSLRIREGTRNLILAAAHSAISPHPYFPRMSRTEAVNLLASVREGQTQRGSFISRFIIPIDPEVGFIVLEEPFGRRVARLLMRSLEGVRRIRSLGSYEDLLGMEGEGVSGNLLGALAMMRPSGDRSTLDLSISWARNRAAPIGVVSRVRFPEEALVGLESVAEAMRNQTQTPGFEVFGYVAKLERPPGGVNAPGDVVLVHRGGEAADLNRVYVHLDAEAYSDALRAHEGGRLVRVIGTLEKSGRRWTLKQASGFELISDEVGEDLS